jgi:hypothetical protein
MRLRHDGNYERRFFALLFGDTAPLRTAIPIAHPPHRIMIDDAVESRFQAPAKKLVTTSKGAGKLSKFKTLTRSTFCSPFMVQQFFPTAPKPTFGATRIAGFQLLTIEFIAVTAFSGILGKPGSVGNSKRVAVTTRGRCSVG